MKLSLRNLLDRCLRDRSPGKSLFVASMGCLIGSFLIISAFQIYADSGTWEDENAGKFITLNKKVEGGLLQNLGSNGKAFMPTEIDQITKLSGVQDLGGFSRNHFPVTVHIWPSGKIGLGSAARADLFFESIPDRFLDQQPEHWQWDENKTFVPIMVPKFYLDLWNFGLAPSRSEYPALSLESASSMPIEIFIGGTQPVRMLGKFVAFSKRINSVLVPLDFLNWANSKHGWKDQEKYYFLWNDGDIEGPPISLSELREMQTEESSEIIVSEITEPEKQIRWSDLVNQEKTEDGPARLIINLNHSSEDEFFQEVQNLGYETNQEQPSISWISKAANALIIGTAGLGALLSFLSIATFTSCLRLMVIQSGEKARNLIHLGFSPKQISWIFKRRLNWWFGTMMGTSLIAVLATKSVLKNLFADYGHELTGSLSWETLTGSLLYAIIFLLINYRVISKTVRSFEASR